MKPKLGDVFLVTNPAENLWYKILFSLARWGTQSPLVHSGIYVGRSFGHDKPQVIEARPGGVGFTDYEKYKTAVWSHLDLTKEERHKIVDFAGTTIGMPYGPRNLIPTALAQARFGALISPLKSIDEQPKWVRKLIRPHYWLCSSLVLYCYMQAGFKTVIKLPWIISTGDLMKEFGVNSEVYPIGRESNNRGFSPWNWIGRR